MISAALRIAAAVWQRHYHVPEWGYWIALVAGTTGAVAGLVTGLYADLFGGEAFDRKVVGGITVATINFIVITVCVVGIIRWHRDRSRARGGLVVPRFYEFAGARNRGQDAQLTILDSLHQNLPQAQQARVYGIKAVADLEHRAFAARLLRRLRAHSVLHGRVVDRSGGGWTVHARLALRATTRLYHFDWHTNDQTATRMPWRAWFSKLPSTFDVTDEEFPLELTRDLEALVRGTAGAAGLASSAEEAEALLREALAASPTSTIPAMDVLRTQLAFAVFFQDDREDEALDLLRERINAGDAFGELLNAFAFLAGMRLDQIAPELDPSDEDLLAAHDEDDEDEDEDDGFTPEQREFLREAEELERRAEELYEQAEELESDDEFESYSAHQERLRKLEATLREERISAWRTAAEDENDPRRDISLYNLITALLGAGLEADDEEKGRGDSLREQAWEHLETLRERSDLYRNLWYVQRLCGLRAWLRFEAISARHLAHSPEGVGAAREAAKWYSRAIRSRPRFSITRFVGFPWWGRCKIRSLRSPILDANAFDAHFYAGHRFRAMYHDLRFLRRRRALLRGAYRDLRRGYLDLANAQLDWIRVGRHDPTVHRFDAVEAAAVAARDRVRALMLEAADHQARHADAGSGDGPNGPPDDQSGPERL